MSVRFSKPRNAGPSDKQVLFLVPKIVTQNETLDSDIEEGCLGAPPKWDRIVPAAIINNYRVNDQISFKIPLEFMKK